MAVAGALEIQLLADVARLKRDMDEIKSITGTTSAQIQRSAKAAADSWDAMASRARSAFAALGVSLSVAGLATLVKSTIDAADRLGDLSKATGVAVGQLVALRTLAKQSGTDLEGVAQSINKLSVNIGKNGEKFTELGITAKDPVKAFAQLADIFTQIQDPQLRATLGAAALGKQWASAAPLLAEGGDKIRRLTEEAEKSGGQMEEFARQADAFNDKLVILAGSGGLLASSIAPLMPLFNQLADDLLKIKAAASDTADGFNPLTEALKAIIVLGGNVGFVFKGIGNDLGAMAAQLAALASGDLNAFVSIGQMAKDDAKAARQEFDSWEASTMRLGTSLADAKLKAGDFDQVSRQMASQAAATAKAEADQHAAAAKATEARVRAALSDKKSAEEADSAYRNLLKTLREKLLADKEQTEVNKTIVALDALSQKQKEAMTDAQRAELLVLADAVDQKKADKEATEQLIKTEEQWQATLADIAAVMEAVDKKRTDAIMAMEKTIAEIKTETELIGKSNAVREEQNAITALTIAGITKETQGYDALILRLREASGIKLSTQTISDNANRIKSLEQEFNLIGLSNVERQKASTVIAAANQLLEIELSYQRQIAAAGQDEDALRRINQWHSETVATLGEQLKKQIQIIDATDQQTKRVEGLRNAWTAIDSAAFDAFSSIFNKGEDTWKKLADSLKQTIIRALYELTVQRWTLQLFADLTGVSAGALAGNAGSTVSGISSLFSGASGASSLYSGASTAYGWLAGSGSSTAIGAGSTAGAFGTATLAGEAGGAFVGGGAVGTAGGLAAGEGSALAAGAAGSEALAALAAAAPYIAAVIAIAAIIMSSSKEPTPARGGLSFTGPFEDNTPPTQTAFGSFGFSDAATQQFSGQVGKAMTDAVGTLLDMAAKQMKPETVAALTKTLHDTVLMSAEGTYSTEDFINKFGPAMARQLLDPVLEAVDPYAKKLVDAFSGPFTDLIAYAGDILTVTGTIKDHGDELQKMFGQAIDLQAIDAARREGESFSGALQRLGTEFLTTNQIAEMMGKTQEEVWGAVGLASEAARAQLIEFAGGADKLTASLGSYYDHYFTAEEKLQRQQEALAQSFSALGETMPTTLEGFRQLVEAQDLTTEAGRKEYAALLALEGQFYNFATATGKVGDAVQKATGLLANLANVLGTAPTGTSGVGGLGGVRVGGVGTVMPPVYTPEQAAAMAAAAAAAQAATDALTKQLDEAKKAADALTSSLTNLIKQSLLGEDVGAQIGETIINGIKAELAQRAADQVAALIRQYLIEPIMAQIVAGGSATAAINAALTQANVDAMVAAATSTMQTLKDIFADPAFIDALNQLGAIVSGIFTTVSSGGDTGFPPGINPATNTPWVIPLAPPGSGWPPGESPQELQQLFEQKLGMLAHLYEITGNAAGAASVLEQQHAIALAALDPSLRDLQEQIWAAEKAATAAAKALELQNATTDLQIQVLRAQGWEEAAIALERQKIIDELTAKWGDAAPALITLQEQIWAALDAKKLADATAAWTKQLQDFLRGLRLDNTLSPLTVSQRFHTAQEQYVEDLLKVQAGDADARSRFTQEAQQYLQEALAMFGRGSTDYNAIFTAIQAQTQALIDQGLAPTAPATLSDVVSSQNAAQQTAQQQADTLIAKVQALTDEVAGLRKETAAATTTAAKDSETEQAILTDLPRNIATELASTGSGSPLSTR